MYRRLNLLYYVSPDWKESFGGNLELWDKNVTNQTTISSKFNRLVIMETNPWSWHSVSKVLVNEPLRCCVSNYYFSKTSPLNKEYYHVTSFMGRPEEKTLRIISHFDNSLRSFLRKIKKDGFSKVDTYKNN